MLALLSLVLTHIFASDVVFLVVRRWLSAGPASGTLFILTRGIGPVVVSWLLYNLLLLVPGRPRAFYVGMVAVFFALLLVLSRRALPELAAVYRTLPAKLRRLSDLRGPAAALAVLLALACLFIVLVGVGLPIVGHDSLILSIDARIMHRDLSLERYFTNQVPDPQTGYLTVNFQTPFLPVLYVWYGLTAGAESMDLLARTTSPLYALYCVMLLIWVVGRRSAPRDELRVDSLLAALVLASTPLFLWMAYDNAQDTPRYYLTFLALLWFARLLDPKSPQLWRLVVTTGVFSGLAVFAHLLDSPAVAAGGLAVLLFSRRAPSKRLAAVAAIVPIALFAAAGYHYAQSPQVRQKLARNFSWGFVREWAQLASTITGATEDESPVQPAAAAPKAAVSAKAPVLEKAAEDSEEDESYVSGLVTSRGQGDTPIARLFLGRLQMFTGIESFGWLFWLFWLALFLWWWRLGDRRPLDLVLLTAVAVYCVIVLSGVRKASWSNPRYIGSLMVVGAYFAGPALGDWLRRFGRKVPRLRRSVAVFAIAFLLVPALLVTTVRGAKLGITNTGTFYRDLRSLQWLGALRRDPPAALEAFRRDYCGGCRLVEYFFADHDEKLRRSHDYLAAVVHFNEQSPPEALAIAFRPGRYFYYARRRGIPWYAIDLYPLWDMETGPEVHERLASLGVTHVLIDSFIERTRQATIAPVLEMLNDPALSEQVYEFGSARIYRVR